MNPSVLALSHAVVSYERHVVLANVTLDIRQGDVAALLGPNGSGKSTLVGAALGLISLDSGYAGLFSQQTDKFSDWARVGYVPQRFNAGNGIGATVTEIVNAGRLARRGFRFANSVDKAAVADAIDAVGLTSRARHSVATLSGGQQQRVLIARALASEPDLLVLDEPTVGVDAASNEALARTLQHLMSQGKTMVLITHEIGPLISLVNREIVMKEGAIIHDAPVGVNRSAYEHDDVHHHPPAPTPNLWGQS